MNYIGSKLKLSDFLKSSIETVVGSINDKVFCDIFAGTGIVGRTFKSSVKQVIANDYEYYSYILNRNYIGNYKKIEKYIDYISELNKLPLISTGFIYNNYCIGGNGQRLYFSDYNGKKIDTVRAQIQLWKDSGYINDDIYYFLLCSLIESADKVANTASVYGAYLKRLKKSAQNEFRLKPAIFELTTNSHKVYSEDANNLIRNISGDILYLDPPYNARQYGANYHLLNTIAEYIPFNPKGKTGLRDYNKSGYCMKSRVYELFEDLIAEAQFKYIFLSYSNEGIMTVQNIQNIMQKYGHYDLIQTDYQRFKSDNSEKRNYKNNSTIEYIHILEKRI